MHMVSSKELVPHLPPQLSPTLVQPFECSGNTQGRLQDWNRIYFSHCQQPSSKENNSSVHCEKRLYNVFFLFLNVFNFLKER